MKNPVSTIARLAARLAPALILASLLPGCFLDESLEPISTLSNWNCQATLVNRTDGTTIVVPYGNTTLEPAASAAVRFIDREDLSTRTVVETWFRTYLREQLQARAAEGSQAFRDVFGNGTEWCVLRLSVEIERPTEMIADLVEPVAAGAPLPDCEHAPLPEDCFTSLAALPELAFDEDPVEFEPLGVGLESAWRPAVLRNSGGARLCVAPVGIVGLDPEDYAFEPGDCVPSSPEEVAARFKFLEPGDTCTVRVRFRPSAGGARRAQLSINSVDPASPALNLNGTGVAGTLKLVAIQYRNVMPDVWYPVDIADGGAICVPAVEPMNEVYAAFFRVQNVGTEGQVTIQSPPSFGGWSFSLWVPAIPPITLAPGETLEFRLRSDLRAPVSRPDPAEAIFNGNQTNDGFSFRTDLQAGGCPLP